MIVKGGEIWLKLVYYGAGLVGKTTNLQYIYEHTNPEQKGKMISLATDVERTLSFHFLPASLAPIDGKRMRFHLYTTPGPVFYDQSRRLVLKGADGVVFVADAQRERAEANVESLDGLEQNLESHGRGLRDTPFVLQHNKMDLPNRVAFGEIDGMLNRHTSPAFEAVARTGVGVFDTLKAAAKLMLVKVRDGTVYR